MRGKGRCPSQEFGRPGITPAHAGKRTCIGGAVVVPRDHPRACGEKSTLGAGTAPLKGSPPRMRGKGAAARIGGSTAVDHPRACGEKCPMCQWRRSLKGSPPRMRGKVPGSASGHPAPRITPAHAGKSIRQAAQRLLDRDHPRACGEKAYSLVINGSEWGSPPRMRGKAGQKGLPFLQKGITPAHAGKSQLVCRFVLALGDHPRACGEKESILKAISCSMGSPPRMRGKAARQRRRFAAAEDHPRACGEKIRGNKFYGRSIGSPPRMRGKGANATSNIRSCRITPAHAGKSTGG